MSQDQGFRILFTYDHSSHGKDQKLKHRSENSFQRMSPEVNNQQNNMHKHSTCTMHPTISEILNNQFQNYQPKDQVILIFTKEKLQTHQTVKTLHRI